jgi:hypothetical protein
VRHYTGFGGAECRSKRAVLGRRRKRDNRFKRRAQQPPRCHHHSRQWPRPTLRTLITVVDREVAGPGSPVRMPCAWKPSRQARRDLGGAQLGPPGLAVGATVLRHTRTRLHVYLAQCREEGARPAPPQGSPGVASRWRPCQTQRKGSSVVVSTLLRRLANELEPSGRGDARPARHYMRRTRTRRLQICSTVRSTVACVRR